MKTLVSKMEDVPVLDVGFLFDGEENIANRFLPEGWKIPGAEGIEKGKILLEEIYAKPQGDVIISANVSREKAYSHPWLAGMVLGLKRNGYNPIWAGKY
jgi:hypothetical protein